jgi:hypothetical protein
MTVFSFNALRHLRGHYMRKIRRRAIHGANHGAKPRQHDHAEHAVTRQMRY